MNAPTDLIEKWRAERERKAYLALEDGTVFHGVSFGYKMDRVGEVVFNTGMCGYQEIVTDPSYAGQFVTLTTAEVGNYGVNGDDRESRSLFLNGLILGDLTAPSNYRATSSLRAYLNKNKIPGIYGVDTRSLTLHLRTYGNKKAYLHVEDAALSEEEAIKKAQAWEGLDGQDYAAKVSSKDAYNFNEGKSDAPLVVCYDFGVKTNILRNLARFANVTVVPAQTPAEDIIKMKPDGIFLSNGPADPAALPYAVKNIKLLLGLAPVMGICLGHQLLALSLGAETGRLKFGHHGCNHPVKNLVTGKVEITSQNHNFAVKIESVPKTLEVTHINLNDQTIEGLRHKKLPAFSVQYHPESCPGPHDSNYLFEEFKKMILGK
ncbi:glutamine-hydrolyzing carbamoyl-phosphate synthase small subunit [bacterium]|nr:glutamine-hydrolyzing carbamoyl-phosphate synthase small subunit [bacterium]